jgi:hypothetical protein
MKMIDVRDWPSEEQIRRDRADRFVGRACIVAAIFLVGLALGGGL